MDVFRINMDNLYLHDDLSFNVGQLDGTYLFTTTGSQSNPIVEDDTGSRSNPIVEDDTGLILTFSEDVSHFYMGLEIRRDAVAPPNYTYDEWREFIERFSGCLGVADGNVMTFNRCDDPHWGSEDEFLGERDSDGDVRMMSITGENEGYDPITGDLYVFDGLWTHFRDGRGSRVAKQNQICTDCG